MVLMGFACCGLAALPGPAEAQPFGAWRGRYRSASGPFRTVEKLRWGSGLTPQGVAALGIVGGVVENVLTDADFLTFAGGLGRSSDYMLVRRSDVLEVDRDEFNRMRAARRTRATGTSGVSLETLYQNNQRILEQNRRVLDVLSAGGATPTATSLDERVIGFLRDANAIGEAARELTTLDEVRRDGQTLGNALPQNAAIGEMNENLNRLRRTLAP